jgi:hypothetical protein
MLKVTAKIIGLCGCTNVDAVIGQLKRDPHSVLPFRGYQLLTVVPLELADSLQ